MLDFPEAIFDHPELPERLNALIANAISGIKVEEYELDRESTHPYFGDSIADLTILELKNLATGLKAKIDQFDELYGHLRKNIFWGDIEKWCQNFSGYEASQLVFSYVGMLSNLLIEVNSAIDSKKETVCARLHIDKSVFELQEEIDMAILNLLNATNWHGEEPAEA